PADGTYILVQSGSGTENPFPYGFKVLSLEDTTTPLTLGELVSGELRFPTEEHRYRFTLPTSSKLYFDTIPSFEYVNWSLTGPAGTIVADRPFTADEVNAGNPVLDLPAGDYTLTIRLRREYTGGYQFRLSDLAAATPISPGTPVQATIDPAF